MLSLCSTNQGSKKNWDGVGRQGAGGGVVESVDSSEEVVIAETSEDDLDCQGEGTAQEERVRSDDSPAVSKTTKPACAELTLSLDSKPAASRGHQTISMAPPHSTPKPVSGHSSGTQGSMSLHLPSPICQPGTANPASVEKSCPIIIETGWQTGCLDSDEDESDEEYGYSRMPVNASSLHFTPTSAHTATNGDQRAAGRQLSHDDDEDDDNGDITLPKLVFSSKRRKDMGKQTLASTVSRTTEKTSVNKGLKLASSRQNLAEQPFPETASSDADIESISSDTEEDGNLPRSSQKSVAAGEWLKAEESAVYFKNALSERGEMTSEQTRETEVMEEETQQAEDETLKFEEFTMEYSQLSPSILEQETQVISKTGQTDDALDNIMISDVRSLNPDLAVIQGETIAQSHSSSEGVHPPQAITRESSGSSGTQPLPVEDIPKLVTSDSTATVDYEVTFPYLKSEDSDLTQPYGLSDTEGSQGPPSLAAVPTIPSILGRQVSGDSLPPPLLEKVSSSIIQDSSHSTVDSNTWPALSVAALETLKTEEVGDSAAQSSITNSCNVQPTPPSVIKSERDLPTGTFSVTVALPGEEGSSLDAQNAAAGQTGLASQLTISVRLPGHVDGHANVMPSLKTEDGPKSQEYPVLMPVKEESLSSVMTKPSNGDEAESDDSQCLFDDLPTAQLAEQGKQPGRAQQASPHSPDMAGEVYMSDAEEDVPLETLVKARAESPSPWQRERLAVQKEEGQESASRSSEDQQGAKDKPDSNKPAPEIQLDVSNTVALVKEEPVSYTLEEDFVMVFDSDEEEMFSSFTQVEVTRDTMDDLDEDLWSDDISEAELLESGMGTVGDKDVITVDDEDEDDNHTRDDVPSNDFALDSADDDDLVEATSSAELGQEQAEKLPSIYSQPTLIEDKYEDISTDDDIYLIDTQIDEDIVSPVNDDQSDRIVTPDDIYLNNTQVDADMLRDDDTSNDDNLSHKSTEKEPEEQEDKHSDDNFDDDMDNALYAAATQVDNDTEVTASYSSDEDKEKSTDVSDASKLQHGKSSEITEPCSNSGSDSPASDVIDLTKESSDELPAVQNTSLTSIKEEEQDAEHDSDTDGEGGKDTGMDLFDCPTLVDNPWLADSDSDDNDVSSGTNKESGPKGKDVFDAQTVGDAEAIVCDDEEEIDFYSMATQRDEDPYLVPTQIHPEAISVSGESDVDNKEEKSDKNAPVQPTVANIMSDTLKTKAKQKSVSVSKSDSSLTEKSSKRQSSDFDAGSQPLDFGDCQDRTRKHSAEMNMESPSPSLQLGNRARRHSGQSDVRSQSSSPSKLGNRTRRHSAESDKGSKPELLSREKLLRFGSSEEPSSTKTIESARETMTKINQRNLMAGAIEIEPLPEIRRRGRRVGLQQKLCRSEKPVSVPEKRSVEQSRQQSRLTDLPVPGTSEQQKAHTTAPKQQNVSASTSSDTEWLKKKPAVPASAKTPTARKRKTGPVTPDISDTVKKARQKMEEREKMMKKHPSQRGAGRWRETSSHIDPDMDTDDVELPSTQERFEMGIPLLTDVRPVLKERLMKPKTTKDDAPSSHSARLSPPTVAVDVPTKPQEHKTDSTEKKGHKMQASSSQKHGEDRSSSNVEKIAYQSKDVTKKIKRSHAESRDTGSRPAAESTGTSRLSPEQEDAEGKSAAKRKKMADGHERQPKEASNEKHRDISHPKTSSRADTAATSSASRSRSGKDTTTSHSRESSKKRTQDSDSKGPDSRDKKHSEGQQSKSVKKHSSSSRTETSAASLKSGSRDKKQSDRKGGDHSKSSESSESRSSDKKHSSGSTSASHSKDTGDKSRPGSLEGKPGSSRSGHGAASTGEKQDSDSKSSSFERKQGDSADFNPQVIARPPTPPRVNTPDQPGEDLSSVSENVQPDLQAPSGRPRELHKKTVRFDLKKNMVIELSQPPPLPLPTFQEILAQPKPAPAQPRQPFFQGNPLQKRPAPLQEQQQQQQYVFKPLVPGGRGVAGPSGQEQAYAGQTLLAVGDFLTEVLKWQSLWFSVYAKHVEDLVTMKPDLLKPPPVVDFKQLYPLVTTYGDRIEEYQSIFLKLHLLETWEELFKSWKEKRNKAVPPCHMFLTETFAQPTPQIMISLGWTGLLTGQEVRQRQFPAEGDVVMINMKGYDLSSHVPSQGRQCEVSQSQLAYVEKINIDKCRDVQSFIARNRALGRCPALQKGGRDLWIYKVSVKIRYRRFAPSNDHPTVIEPVGNITSAIRRYTALQMLPRCPLMPEVLSPRAQASDRAFHIPAALLGRTQFNQEQSQAIDTMLNAVAQPPHVSRICLLQGPPGTGKSHVLIGLILKMLERDKNTKICLSAPSNAAADELLRRLAKRKKTDRINFSLVRIGKTDSIHSDVKEFALENKISRAKESALMKKKQEFMPQSVRNEYERLTKKMEKLDEDISKNIKENNTRQADTLQKELRKVRKLRDEITKNEDNITLSGRELTDIFTHELKRAQVVCGTLSSFGQPKIINTLCRNPADNRRIINHFTCAIIDEATQATELDSLIPLQYGVTKLFLVGDPNQLPPTVLSAKAQNLNFGLSLFERLFNHFQDQEAGNQSVMMLRTQYRMDPAICLFPNSLIYNNLLRTDKKIEEYCQKFPFHPYTVFNVEEGQELLSHSGTLSNEMEAECTAVLCEELMRYSKQIIAQNIGIICPYAGQKRLVFSKLRERRIEGVEVNTVDGFQGREKHIIILSCVRARSSSGGIGFIADRRRMNVALTRAKYALYIIAHLQSLRADGDWKSLIEDAEERQVTQHVPSVQDFPAIIRQHCFKRPAAKSDQ